MAPLPPAIPNPVQDWLLDPADPGPRYLALKQLSPAPAPELPAARAAAHQQGPIAAILEALGPEGRWPDKGAGYLPKYTSSAWSLITLAQLGAAVEEDPRIDLACRNYLERALNPGGQISSNGPPSGTVDCLQGNILASLTALGYQDPGLEPAWDWLARTITGEGMAPMADKKAPRRYYAGKIGPDFQCGANNKLPCAWGATKALLALAALPEEERTPLIEAAIQRGVEFLLGVDPAAAAYPTGYAAKPSGNWWKFGFPVYYVTDLVQLCQALGDLGCREDPRLENSLALIREKMTPDGKWLLEYGYQGKGWVDFGDKKGPNKWVTIRAYQALGSQLPA